MTFIKLPLVLKTFVLSILEWSLKGFANLQINLQKNFFQTPIEWKASNDRNRMSKAPSKIQNSYKVMKVAKFN